MSGKTSATVSMQPIRLLVIGIISGWAVFCIHHAYEAGLARSNGPIAIVCVCTAVLIATLVLLEAYKRTGHLGTYVLFSVTLLWWVGALGLIEGFYGHVLKDILYFLFHVAPTALPRAPLGLTYDVPTNVFGELTGILPFLSALLVVVGWVRLEIQRRAGALTRHAQQASASAR